MGRLPILPFLFLLLSPGALAATAPAGLGITIHATLYEGISLTAVSEWIPTEIAVPKGAVVAVMATGEVWNAWGPAFRCGPSSCLRFRVGDDGPPRGLSSYHAREGVVVVRSPREGRLRFIIGPGFKHRKNKRADMTATVMVWDREAGTKVEEDLERLVQTRPGHATYEALRLALARALTQTGEYSRAEALLQRIRESAGGEERVKAIALVSSADNENWMRRYDRAQAFASEAIKAAREAGLRGMEVEALLHLAEAQSHTDQRDRAIEVVSEALNLLSEGTKGLSLHRRRGRAHAMLGSLMWMGGRNGKALEHYRQAAEGFKKAGAWSPLAQALFLLARSQERAGMREEAQRSLEKSLKIASAVGRQETLWRIHSLRGKMAERDGDWQGAFGHYADAIRIIESLRGEVADPAARAAFMENKLLVYERMIQLLQRRKRAPEAFHYLERAKARVMLDVLREKAFSSRKGEENALLIQERELKRQLEEAERSEGDGLESARSEEEGPEAGEGSEDLQPPQNEAFLRLRQEYAAVMERIERLNPELASLVTVNPLKAPEIQALLEEDTALLAYYVGWELTVVFVVTRDQVVSVPLDTTRKALLERILRFRKEAVEEVSLDRVASGDYDRPLSELYEMLIGPVQDQLAGKRHLVIVPHGVLHYLPFQALLSKGGDGRGKGYLIESFTVSYLPSASVLKFVRMKKRGRKEALLAVGNPATGLAPLPAAEIEAREVSALFTGPLLLTGREATETSVKAQGPRFDMVLLSTHGEMIESDPLRSNLRFAPSGNDDGRLTVGEIFDMEVKADLVTLSACETGLARGTKGGFPTGDDLVGLSRAFIHAGAPSVVASLWKVSDDSTVALMRAFYEGLRQMPKAEALRQAQLDLMRTRLNFRLERGTGGITRSPGYRPGVTIDCSHPFFWAPFILVGDWR